MKRYHSVQLALLGDQRGHLAVAEEGREIPFTPRRIFYIYGTEPGARRGAHANRHSQFWMVCVAGSCQVDVDDGHLAKTYSLADPGQALYIDRLVWKEMYNFSKDAVLLVLSSELYDQTEYIREYAAFLRERA